MMRPLLSLFLLFVAITAHAAPSLQEMGCATREQCVQDGMKLHETKEYAKALPYFEAACAEKQGVGCQNVAVIYYKGLGVQKDVGLAFQYFEKACEYGVAGLCRMAGMDYFNGRVVPKDYGKALRLLERGCTLNDSTCCYVAGAIRVDESLEFHDAAAAIKHLDKGCFFNEGGACEMLGRIYKIGQGVPVNMAKARSYFEKGCTLKNEKACAILKEADAPKQTTRNFNVTVSSMTVDGLEARDLKCQLSKTGLLTSAMIVGGLAKQGDALQACAKGGPQTPKVSMTFQGNVASDIQVEGVPADVAECVKRAISKISVDNTGYCEVVLPLGK